MLIRVCPLERKIARSINNYLREREEDKDVKEKGFVGFEEGVRRRSRSMMNEAKRGAFMFLNIELQPNIPEM